MICMVASVSDFCRNSNGSQCSRSPEESGQEEEVMVANILAVTEEEEVLAEYTSTLSKGKGNKDKPKDLPKLLNPYEVCSKTLELLLI